MDADGSAELDRRAASIRVSWVRGWPSELDVVVETPKGGFAKRRPDGALDFVSPLPCPWNYGCAPEHPGGDGDALDAVVLGRRLPRGTRVRLPVRGVVRFVDGGLTDDKLVVGRGPLRRIDRLALRGFFTVYARLKRLRNRMRGVAGVTRFDGLSTP
jgi:inorganic pyrophosphatase